MNLWAAQGTFFDRPAGPRLRCFLSPIVAAMLIWLPSSQVGCAQGIVDCVYPGHVTVSRVRGQVFDPSGVVLPGVVVTLVDQRGSTLQTTTDHQGRFQVAASPGKYSFKAALPLFQASQAELIVGEDLAGLIHPSKLRVILGMAGSFCPWVSTSGREFRNIIRSNKKRIEESAQRNAMQE